MLQALSLAIPLCMVGLRSSDARGDEAYPCPANAKVPEPALSSPEVNDFAHEIWSVEDDTVFKPPPTNVAAGVLAGPAGFFTKSHDLTVHVLGGPAVFYRLNIFSRSAGLPTQAIARGEMRLDRITGSESEELHRKIRKQLVEVQDELTHIATVKSSMDGEDRADASPERRDYIEKVERDLDRQTKEEKQRGEGLCSAELQATAWTHYALDVDKRIDRYRYGGFTGIEFMLGYGFDITNPTTNHVYSGAVGGVGLTMLLWRAGFSLGVMVQQDGLLGGYLSVSAPVL
jgi:hypothetical protein